jgi:protein-S-isoprenylcysteine O-methyltransferase Ste14
VTVGGRAGWRWANVPLPEAHMVGLGAGLLLEAVTRWRLPWPVWVGHAVGWPLVAAGLALVVWAVRAAGQVPMDRPDRLVRSGPYALVRHPMYLAWTLVYLGLTFALRAVWPLLLLPAVLIRVHVEAVREERALAERFGAEYAGYRASVRRWL